MTLTATFDSWARFFKKTTGWRQVLPPDGEAVHLFDVCMVDEATGFAVGRRGCIIKTIDSGQTWLRLTHDQTTKDLYAVDFADSSTGYAVGKNGTVLRTDDGGVSWVAQPCPLGNNLSCMGVSILNAQQALLVGGTEEHRWKDEYSNSYKPGYVFLTNDGGKNWSPPQSTPAIVPFLNDISMGSPTTGVAVGGCWDNLAGTYSLTTIIMGTTDGGQSWTQQSFPADVSFPPLMGKVSLYDPGTAIALAYEGPPMYTSDGQTWHRGIVDWLLTGLTAVCFSDKTTAFLVGSQFRGHIFKSKDAGANWATIDHQTYPSLRGISFGRPSTGIAVGEFSTVVRTVDAGENWQPCGQFLPWPVGSDEDMEDIDFQGETGYAVGWRGTVIKSTDAGATWQRINSVLPGLSLVCFKDQQAGFFAIDPNFGRRGLFRTVDGGVTIEEFRTANNGDTYIVQPALGTASWAGRISAMAFGDSQTGVFFGNVGTLTTVIYRTTDGGSSWRRVSDPEPPLYPFYGAIRDVQFLNSSTVIAVGGKTLGGGIVLRSFDAGISWQRLDLPFSSWDLIGPEDVPGLSAVHFPPGQDQVGFAVGSFVVIKTVDGGISWTQVRIAEPFQRDIYSHWNHVHFFDLNTGWIVGSGTEGVIARTYDGGRTWQEQGMPDGNFPPLSGASFLSRNVSVVVGAQGFVARTINGGE